MVNRLEDFVHKNWEILMPASKPTQTPVQSIRKTTISKNSHYESFKTQSFHPSSPFEASNFHTLNNFSNTGGSSTSKIYEEFRKKPQMMSSFSLYKFKNKTVDQDEKKVAGSTSYFSTFSNSAKILKSKVSTQTTNKSKNSAFFVDNKVVDLPHILATPETMKFNSPCSSNKVPSIITKQFELTAICSSIDFSKAIIENSYSGAATHRPKQHKYNEQFGMKHQSNIILRKTTNYKLAKALNTNVHNPQPTLTFASAFQIVGPKSN